jgi:hypothetical protein
VATMISGIVLAHITKASNSETDFQI